MLLSAALGEVGELPVSFRKDGFVITPAPVIGFCAAIAAVVSS